MPNQKKQLHDKTFASFNGGKTEPTLSSLIVDLYTQQKDAWPQLSLAIGALYHVRIRDLRCNGLSVKLQFNPARIVSTEAAIDPTSIKKRPCFLCPDTLPKPQKGVLYHRHFLILCNPYPIFRQHYTVAHVDHISQSISTHVDSFLKLAKDLSPDFNVFYNGPRAGASAPDHLHFQALPAGVLPIEKELHGDHNRHLVKTMDGISLFKLELPGRQILVVEGKSVEEMAAALINIADKLRTILMTADEPIMNFLCSYRDDTWQLTIFLRRKHRPDVFFIKGEGRILISPGLVEMAGLVITPIEKDFATLDAETMGNIYREVSLDPETARQVVGAL
jgi:hypothetical protein